VRKPVRTATRVRWRPIASVFNCSECHPVIKWELTGFPGGLDYHRAEAEELVRRNHHPTLSVPKDFETAMSFVMDISVHPYGLVLRSSHLPRNDQTDHWGCRHAAPQRTPILSMRQTLP
jgi:hypothetical protein